MFCINLLKNTINLLHLNIKQKPTQMEKMIRKGIGSLAHNDRWFLFDQLLFSLNWNKDKEIFLLKTAVYNPSFLRTKRSNYHGYPFRTKIHGTRLEGFSDYFPVYTIVGLSL